MAQTDGRELCMPLKQRNPSFCLDHFSKFLKYFEKRSKWTKNSDFFASEAYTTLSTFWVKLGYSRIKIGVHLMNVELSQLFTLILIVEINASIWCYFGIDLQGLFSRLLRSKDNNSWILIESKLTFNSSLLSQWLKWHVICIWCLHLNMNGLSSQGWL